jgi:general stress protein 26
MTNSLTRRTLLSALPIAGIAGVHARLAAQAMDTAPAAEPARGAVYRVNDETVIISAARSIVDEDTVGALITVDEVGHPRSRSVGVSVPDYDMAMWIATHPGTRKIAQLRANPRATLYFSDDAQYYYASFMGTATIHTDEETLRANIFYEGADLAEFWPNFPADTALIRFVPDWLEVAGHGIPVSPDNWQPQGVVLNGES